MTEQLYEAAILLAVGMLVVFSFLSLLILGIHSIAAFVRAFPGKEDILIVNNVTTAPKPAEIGRPSKDVIAAITAAIHTHRQKHK